MSQLTTMWHRSRLSVSKTNANAPDLPRPRPTTPSMCTHAMTRIIQHSLMPSPSRRAASTVRRLEAAQTLVVPWRSAGREAGAAMALGCFPVGVHMDRSPLLPRRRPRRLDQRSHPWQRQPPARLVFATSAADRDRQPTRRRPRHQMGQTRLRSVPCVDQMRAVRGGLRPCGATLRRRRPRPRTRMIPLRSAPEWTGRPERAVPRAPC